MKIEQQVASLELSKRLNELGMKKPSHFDWMPKIGFAEETEIGSDGGIDWVESKVLSSDTSEYSLSSDPADEWRPGIIPAYTVAELGEMLPRNFEVNGEILFMSSDKMTNTWKYIFRDREDREVRNMTAYPAFPKNDGTDTEADARAEMLVYLLENKLIEIKE